jgi:hypothetical protein
LARKAEEKSWLKSKIVVRTRTGGNAVVKASDSAFEAARNAYTLYGWLLQEVAKETSWDKALASNAGVGDRLGGLVGGIVRAKCGERKPDAACISAVL